MISRLFTALSVILVASSVQAATVTLDDQALEGRVQLFITDIGAFDFDTVNIVTNLNDGSTENAAPAALFTPLGDSTGVNGLATIAGGLALFGLETSDAGVNVIISSTTPGVRTDQVLAGQSGNPLLQLFSNGPISGAFDVAFALAGDVVGQQTVPFGSVEIPEPASLALVSLSIAGVVARRRRV